MSTRSRIQFEIIPADSAAPIVPGSAVVDTTIEKSILEYLGGDCQAQRIEIVLDDEIKGMYVDDLAHLKDLPRNERATALYRGHYLDQHPQVDPESVPFIAGPAVLLIEAACGIETLDHPAAWGGRVSVSQLKKRPPTEAASLT